MTAPFRVGNFVNGNATPDQPFSYYVIGDTAEGGVLVVGDGAYPMAYVDPTSYEPFETEAEKGSDEFTAAVEVATTRLRAKQEALQ